MIRLQRVGRKHEPVFRLVLTDSKNGPKSGKFLEILGSYDMRLGDSSNFKTDRIKELMSTGTQVSDTVHNILIDKKVIEGKKINNLPKKTALKKEAAEAPAEAAPQEEVKEAAPAATTEAPAPETAPEEEKTETKAEEAEAVSQ